MRRIDRKLKDYYREVGGPLFENSLLDIDEMVLDYIRRLRVEFESTAREPGTIAIRPSTDVSKGEDTARPVLVEHRNAR